MWFDGAVLRFSRGTFEGQAGDETVAVTDDGTVWLWVARPGESARRGLVGTFRGRVGPEEVAQARELAGALTGPPLPPGGAPARTLAVSSAVGALVVPHSSMEPFETRLRRLADALTGAALAAPLATARFSGRFTPADPPRVHLVVHHGGQESLCLLLTPAACAAQWLDDAGQVLASGPLPTPELGLVDVDAALLDGLRRPATLAEGVAGALSVTSDPPPGARALALRVTGRLTFRTPEGTDDLPADPFEATTAPVPLPPS